jgi:hypothetical protein
MSATFEVERAVGIDRFVVPGLRWLIASSLTGCRPARWASIVVMFVGIGFIAVLTAAAAERFLRVQREERNELEGVEQRLDEILTRLDAIERKRD